MKKWFRFTIRDWFWLMLLFAACFGWYSERYSREQASVRFWREIDQIRRDEAKGAGSLHEQNRLLQEEFAAKNEAAVDRELDLKTTVRALKLRLGEDPYGK